MKVRLKAIVPNVDFRQSESTIWDQFKKSKQWRGELKPSEVYAFVNRERTMMWLIHSDTNNVLRAERWRRRSMYWDDAMIADYFLECGYELIGIKTLREQIEAGREARKGGGVVRPAWQKLQPKKKPQQGELKVVAAAGGARA